MLSTFLLFAKSSSIGDPCSVGSPACTVGFGQVLGSETVLPSVQTYFVLQAVKRIDKLNNKSKIFFTITPTTLFRYINLTTQFF